MREVQLFVPGVWTVLASAPTLSKTHIMLIERVEAESEEQALERFWKIVYAKWTASQNFTIAQVSLPKIFPTGMDVWEFDDGE